MGLDYFLSYLKKRIAEKAEAKNYHFCPLELRNTETKRELEEVKKIFSRLLL